MLMTGSGLEGGKNILKVKGNAPKERWDEESSKSPSMLKGMDVKMPLWDKINKWVQKTREKKEAVS